MLKNKALIAPLGLVGITILSGVFLMSSYSYATSDNTDAVDDVSITVPVSCSMEGTGMNSHNANIVNGTYQADIGSTTLKAFCNDTNGFAIYAIGFTDDEYGKTVLTNSILGSTYDIATGTATSGNTSNWAMKLATDGTATYAITLDNSFNAYHNVPTTYTKVAHRDSGTDIGAGATGAELTSTYAAYMNQTQPAGTYSGKVKYTLVHPASEEPLQPQPATAGCINYFANASTAVGEMGCQTASNNASVDLWASNFSRTGYGFAGWNDKYDYSGTNYGPNQDITAPADVETNGLSLYAVWIKSAGSLQNWTGCGSLASGATTALTDERDNNTYAIAKLADGKCWMIENLRLDNTAQQNTSGSLAQGYNSSFIGLADPESANFSTDSTTANSLYSTDGSTAATISGSYQDCRFPRYNNNNTNSRQSSYGYLARGNTYSMGNYYTWPAAVADTTHYSGGNHNTTSSICPAGWHIPTGVATTSEFALLDIALGGTGSSSTSSTDPTGAVMSSRYRSYPNNFLYSGYFDGRFARGRGSYGSYWSSTTNGSSTSYYLYLDGSNASPGTNLDYKYYGLAIRCTLGS